MKNLIVDSGSEEEFVQNGKVNKHGNIKLVDKTERCLKILDHASNCEDKRCTSTPCRRMKCIIRHSRFCTKRRECPACRQLVALCFQHASICGEKEDCKSLYCDYLRPIFAESLQNAS